MPLTILVTSADGQQYRFGADEPDSAWVPFGINWESTVPGGWKGGGFSLRRRIDEDVELRLFDEVEIVDEHGQAMYEGRVVKLPRQHGDDYLYNVECLGWASHLLDDKSFREVYVDQDQGSLSGFPLARRQLISGGGVSIGDFSWAVEEGGLTCALPNQALGTQTLADIWGLYPAGVTISKIVYNGTYTSLPGGWQINLRATDDLSVAGDTYSLIFDSTTREQILTTPRRYVGLQLYSNGNAVTPAAGALVRATIWAAYGSHGLTVIPLDTVDPAGFYIDDVLAHAISRAAPKINYTAVLNTGVAGSLERPPLTVVQANYSGGSVEDVLLDLNKLVLWDWLVYENKTLFYRPTDPDRLTWEARLDRGIHLSLEGDDAEHAYNGAMVRYTTPDGIPKVAGPTGSGFDVESDLLLDEDTENTVSQHGYPRRWLELDISFTTLDDYAVAIGAAYLAQTSLPARSGDITLKGDVEHPTKGFRPAREIRAGDWIRLSDHPADVPRRIISCRHSDEDGSTVVSVGNDLNKVDAMLEQLAVAVGRAPAPETRGGG